jgi:hypothetical protein
VASSGNRVDADAVVKQLRSPPWDRTAGDGFIYTLFIAAGDMLVPVYIGKTDAPGDRWATHLHCLESGQGSYRRWRQLLLDGGGCARYDMSLLVAPLSAVATPPIPGFPVTAGSVEYQLIGLASDAYPATLLNCEGNRR